MRFTQRTIPYRHSTVDTATELRNKRNVNELILLPIINFVFKPNKTVLKMNPTFRHFFDVFKNF